MYAIFVVVSMEVFHNPSLRKKFNKEIRQEMEKMIHKSASRPTSSRNWGWCSKNCYKTSHVPQRLQEIKIDVLTRSACKVFGRAEKANPKLEICTGRKTSYPIIETYILLEHSGSAWYERKVIAERY